MLVKVDIKTKSLVRVMFVVILFVLAVMAINAAKSALVLIAASAFLAVAVSPAVNWIANKLPGHSRVLATAISYTSVIALISVLVSVFIPPLIRQTTSFVDNVPVYIDELKANKNQVSDIINKYKLSDDIENLAVESTKNLTKNSGDILDNIKQFFSSMASVLTVIILTFFMLVEGPSWIARFWAVQDPKHRAHRKELVEKMYKIVTGFVNGQFLVGSLAATSSFIAMSLLGVDFALPLAVIVGLLDMIPMIGATIGAVIAVTGAALSGIMPASIMLIYFIIYQQVENNLIQPIVQSKTVSISPLTIFVAAIIGVYTAGLTGAIVAIPVAACIRVLVNDYIDNHVTNKYKE